MMSERFKTGIQLESDPNQKYPISMMTTHMLASLQRVHRAAVVALTTASAGHVQVHLGVGTVDLHMRFGVGAIHASLGVEV